MLRSALQHFNAASPLLQEVGKDFLETTGLGYLMIRRTYKDGRFTWICNLDNYMEDFFDKHIIVPKVEHISLPLPIGDEIRLWNEELPVMTLNYALERFNITNGMTFYIENPDYMDCIGMAFQGNIIQKPFSFYSNILPQIHQLKKDLYQETRLWDMCDEKGPLFVAPPLPKSPLCDALAMTKENNTLIVHNPFKTIDLSLEESLCVFWIKRGKNISELSNLIHLPMKSIKNMIQNLSNRLERPFYEILQSC